MKVTDPIIADLYQKFIEHRKVSTDTRKVEKDSIFFALKGPNFDANQFAEQALIKGASYAVIDNPELAANERFILVEDALEALQLMANYYRKQLKMPIIGLTGSNGKTTTKELIASVLKTKYKTLATSGNLNNHIGVPLTLLSIKEDHELAVIEMGANHIGEIAALCTIAEPTHGLITNIGKAHLEGFGGFEGVVLGKSELYHYLIQTDGVVWINSRNDILKNMGKRFENPLFYPGPGDYYNCELKSTTPTLEILAEGDVDIKSQLIGTYNFENIAAALCIGKYFGIKPASAKDAIENYQPTNNRSQLLKTARNTIVLDAYNANPTSMSSALNNLKNIVAKQKVVILGDMKELGESSKKEHAIIGEMLASMQLDKIFLYGTEIKPAADILKKKAFYFTDKNELIAALKSQGIKESYILIKGSRSMGLEKVTDVL